MRLYIEQLLHSSGISRNYIGYDYFVEAILLAMEDPERLHHICKEIYIPVAEKYHTTRAAVERNLRTIRDICISNHGIEYLSKIGYNYHKQHTPYPSELIAFYSYYCKLTYSGKTPK